MNPFARPIPHGALSVREVDNAGLIEDTVSAARIGAMEVRGGLLRPLAARLCHQYVKYHTLYLEETDPDFQMPRMPWRFVSDGVGDCKSQAIYIAAVCAASGCKVLLRFVTLPGDSEPGHVYAIVDNMPCDPLLEFGQECPSIASRDFRIP